MQDLTLAGGLARGFNSRRGGASGSGYGGAVFNLNGSLTVVNSTLAGNTVGGANAAGGALYSLGLDGVRASAVPGQTATIGTASGAQATLVNSLFANTAGGTDIVNNNGTVAGSNNLATQAAGLPPGVASTTTALLNLGPLAANGGPTQTLAIATGSAALAAGVDTTQAPYNLTTDQRGPGFPRKTGTAVDLGAFQAVRRRKR
ncbi:MAG: choice-of-anchor Q domain-containing protein [Gemmataceae bacterium]